MATTRVTTFGVMNRLMTVLMFIAMFAIVTAVVATQSQQDAIQRAAYIYDTTPEDTTLQVNTGLLCNRRANCQVGAVAGIAGADDEDWLHVDVPAGWDSSIDRYDRTWSYPVEQMWLAFGIVLASVLIWGGFVGFNQGWDLSSLWANLRERFTEHTMFVLGSIISGIGLGVLAANANVSEIPPETVLPMRTPGENTLGVLTVRAAPDGTKLGYEVETMPGTFNATGFKHVTNTTATIDGSTSDVSIPLPGSDSLPAGTAPTLHNLVSGNPNSFGTAFVNPGNSQTLGLIATFIGAGLLTFAVSSDVLALPWGADLDVAE
jgi:hypothetical protein